MTHYGLYFLEFSADCQQLEILCVRYFLSYHSHIFDNCFSFKQNFKFRRWAFISKEGINCKRSTDSSFPLQIGPQEQTLPQPLGKKQHWWVQLTPHEGSSSSPTPVIRLLDKFDCTPQFPTFDGLSITKAFCKAFQEEKFCRRLTYNLFVTSAWVRDIKESSGRNIITNSPVLS